jgi:hypothetical protein
VTLTVPQAEALFLAVNYITDLPQGDWSAADLRALRNARDRIDAALTEADQ